MSDPIGERRIGRVLVDNDDLLKHAGLYLAEGVALVRVLPAYDRLEFGSCHWLFLAGPEFDPVPKYAVVPEYKFVVNEDRTVYMEKVE